MQTPTLSVHKLFQLDRRYVVPLYQRPYVWNRGDQWEPLWEDVRAVADTLAAGKQPRAHFLGAIVLEQQLSSSGELEVRLVIDGQQRLTTVQIILKALADVCAKTGAERHAALALRLTRNENLLVGDDPDGNQTLKLFPTNLDRVTYRDLLDANSLDAVMKIAGRRLKAADCDDGLLGAYLFFATAYLKWLRSNEEGFETRVAALYAAVADHVRVVVIDLEREDDAQVIFETLNARGTPLLPADLVKNALFHRARMREESADALYRQHWEPFDRESRYWRKPIGRGHAKRARIDIFLQHYLTMRKRTEVSVTHLYGAFRDFLAQDTTTAAGEHLAELSRFAAIYAHFDAMPEGTREGLFFRRLAAVEVTSAHALLLDLFERCAEDEVERTRTLAVMESYLVRRMVCQLNTRGYSRLFVDLLVAVSEADGAVTDRVRAFFLSSQAESARWPNDDEFHGAWTTMPLFTALTQSRVRMLLEALERELRSDRTESIRFNQKLPIEHLMPQSWREHWPLPTEPDPHTAADARGSLIHTVGNLTLLTQSLNSSISNGPWEDKRANILQHSALNMNRPFATIDRWDEEAIRRRSEDLFDVALRVWPGPDA